jgi:hypothetical protein
VLSSSNPLNDEKNNTTSKSYLSLEEINKLAKEKAKTLKDNISFEEFTKFFNEWVELWLKCWEHLDKDRVYITSLANNLSVGLLPPLEPDSKNKDLSYDRQISQIMVMRGWGWNPDVTSPKDMIIAEGLVKGINNESSLFRYAPEDIQNNIPTTRTYNKKPFNNNTTLSYNINNIPTKP